MKNLRNFAIQTAKQAGAIIAENYGKMQELEYVLKTNFRTQVDTQCDALIREAITKAYPTHSIYSEEDKDKSNNSEYSWVVDPLDGTMPYIYGFSDLFAVCIALVKGKTPILGVIYAPLRNELYVGETGSGATCNGKPIHVSEVDDINKAMVAVDYGRFNRKKILRHQKALLQSNGVTYTISLACASMELAFVASGKLQAHIALQLQPWDMAAAIPIIREAGGHATTIDDKEWELGDESILSANPSLHTTLIQLMNK